VFQISAGGWILAGACALMVGLTKTAIPGLNILFVPLFAQVLPARVSTGALLPLLIIGDVFAVVLYQRHAVWRHLVRLLPWTGIGIVLGYILMGRLDDRTLKPVIGAVVIAMLAVNIARGYFGKAAKEATPDGERDTRAGAAGSQDAPDAAPQGQPTVFSAVFSAATGLLAGAASMVANAAGPIMLVYLVSMRLPKNAFLGTAAWFFLIVNCVKIPFSASLGLITPASLLFDALLAAAVAAGALIGSAIARRIPQKAFGIAVQALTLGAAVLMFL
jgi:uncharacterized membrane protein YfcA